MQRVSSSHESSLPSPSSHPSGIKFSVKHRTKSLVRILYRKKIGSPSSVRSERRCDSTGLVLMHHSQFMPWTNSPEGSHLSALSFKTPSPRRWKVYESRNVGRAANRTPGLTLSTGLMCSPIIGSDHFADMPHPPSRKLRATQKAHRLHHRTSYVYRPRFWHLCPCLCA
jgi:hypothetical protein